MMTTVAAESLNDQTWNPRTSQAAATARRRAAVPVRVRKRKRRRRRHKRLDFLSPGDAFNSVGFLLATRTERGSWCTVTAVTDCQVSLFELF